MLRRSAFLPAMALFAALATNAQAGLLQTFAPLDGVADTLEDNSRAQVFRYDQNTQAYVRIPIDVTPDENGLFDLAFLQANDIIVGIIRIDQQVNAPGFTPLPTDQLVGVFSVQIASTSTTVTTIDDFGNPVNVTVASHIATPDGTGLSLKELIDSSHYAGVNYTGTSTQIDGTDAAFWSGAAIAVFEKTGTPNPIGDTTTDGLQIIKDIGANNSGWTLDAIGGFYETDDFLHIRVTSSTVNINNPSFTADERAGLTIAAHSLGSGTSFLPVQAIGFGAPNTGTFHDLVIIPTTQVTKYSGEATNWNLQDTAFLRLNMIPEPGSMTLLGLGLIGLAGAGYRRRKAEQLAA